MKGIILAGGRATRLMPLSLAVSKQMMPVYDKPMIYYPLSVLMMAGLTEVLIISTPEDLPLYKKLLDSGEQLGMTFEYIEQPKPEGLAQAFILGRDFVEDDSVALILGDNIFYGSDVQDTLEDAREHIEDNGGGMVFAYHVSDPERYGVIDFNKDGKVLSIEEKPEKPKSSFAVPGLYFYDNEVVEISNNLKPSDRDELEITDVNKKYLDKDKLKVAVLSRGTAWFDSGTHESLLQSANFVQTVEKRQGLKIGCIEEVAFRQGFINAEQLKELAGPLMKSGYGNYLMEVAEEK